MANRKALGRGLDALLPGSVSDLLSGEELLQIPVEEIKPNPDQPRKDFDEENLKSLAESIKSQGVLQPVLVRKADKGYELIAGERRLRASQIAGLKRIPAVVIKETDPAVLFFFSLVENLQREDLNPIEEAQAYQHLMEDFNLTQEQIAGKVGKSRPVVANSMRLLKLPEEIKQLIIKNKLSAGHARALLAVEDEDRQIRLGKLAVSKALSVERLEILARADKPSPRHKRKSTRKVSRKKPEWKAHEDQLSRYLGYKVKIVPKGKGGQITIDFYSDHDLKRILEILSED